MIRSLTAIMQLPVLVDRLVHSILKNCVILDTEGFSVLNVIPIMYAIAVSSVRSVLTFGGTAFS